MSTVSDLTLLESTGLIRLAATQPELEYLFRHTLVQDAAYFSLVKADRRGLHRRVGESLERLFPDQRTSRDLAPMLAHHFYQAGDEQRALVYFHAAGSASLAVYANAEAAADCLRAVEIARSLPAKALAGGAGPQGADEAEASLKSIYLTCGAALQRVGRYDEAVALYQELQQMARQRGDRPLELAALMTLANVHSIGSPAFDPERGKALSAEALELARSLNDREAEARILWLMMLVRFFSGEMAKVREYGEQALALARQLHLKELRAYILNDLAGYVYDISGEKELGRAALQEARAIWHEIGNQYMLADNLVTTGLNEFTYGQYDEALGLLAEAEVIARRTGNAWGRAYCRGVQGIVLLERGQVDETIAAFTEAIETGEQSFVAVQTIGRAYLSALYSRLGEADRALELARLAVAQSEEQVPFWRPLALGAEALALLQGGEADRAATLVAEGLKWRNLEQQAGHMALLLMADCALSLARHEYELAAERAGELAGDFRRRSLLSSLPYFLWYQGRALAALGPARRDEAHAVLEQAIALARELSAPHAHWRALAELARLLAAAGQADEAESLRQQAHEILETLAGTTADAKLRASLLALPDAREVIGV